jgi:transcriptional regulator with XRE-family HTH domain
VIDINQIKKLRVNKELTQAQVAEACGVSQGTVAQWEKGLCFPRAAKIPALSRVLECDSEELLRLAEDHQKVGA